MKGNESSPPGREPTSVAVVIPVYNEESVLAQSIDTLRQFLEREFAARWTIVIADNGSTDGTCQVAQELTQRHPNVAVLHLDQKGRGRALRRALLESTADVVAYMDVDLSTDLESFPELVQAIEEGYGIAIGSRLIPQSSVERCFKREVTSRVYNLLLRAMFRTDYHDAQCGFKALSRQAARDVLPLTRNHKWFFDTEMLLIAHRRGYRIKEVPVKWTEDPDSKVSIVDTSIEYVKELLRMRFRPPR
ncbi:MAG: dolichyl-phosphate beta-glucosyltransferase [Chloroflexota bacterium]|nr:dolichyl-phosphate beta-glucosyltransferase [Chloroflexota bacterium]